MTTQTTGRYLVEVIADNSGKWCGNALRFDTKEAAEEYGRDLSGRWTAVREYRVVDTEAREVEASRSENDHDGRQELRDAGRGHLVRR